MAFTHHRGAVDCDVHCAPRSFQDLFPYLSDYWRQYLTEAGVRLTDMAHAYPPAVSGETPHTYAELAQRYLEPAEPQLAVLNCVTGFETHRNPYYAAAVASAINDWVRAEFLERDERLRASVAVSAVSPEDAVAEIERVGDDPRFVQVLLPVRSDLPWGNKNNHPMFAAAQERSLQIGLHAWGRSGRAPTPSGFTTTYLEDYLGNQPIAQAQLLSFVSEGVFERFADLRVMLMECGFAWLPPLLWRFDKDWKGVWREVPWVKGPRRSTSSATFGCRPPLLTCPTIRRPPRSYWRCSGAPGCWPMPAITRTSTAATGSRRCSHSCPTPTSAQSCTATPPSSTA